jgi:hypothetical protein
MIGSPVGAGLRTTTRLSSMSTRSASASSSSSAAAETVVEVHPVGHRLAVVAVSEQGEFLSQVHGRDGIPGRSVVHQLNRWVSWFV